MSNFLGRVRGYVGLCGHGSAYFAGSVRTSGGISHYIYDCPDCGRVFKSKDLIAPLDSYNGCRIEDGTMLFSIIAPDGSLKSDYHINPFIDLLHQGKLLFSRESLRSILHGCTVMAINEREHRLEALNMYNEVLQENGDLRAVVNALQSIIDNNNNVIHSEEEFEIMTENEKQVKACGMVVEWLTELLLKGSVVIPFSYHKLFHLLLKTLYGYEPMRYRWKWDMYIESGEKFYKFVERKERRNK